MKRRLHALRPLELRIHPERTEAVLVLSSIDDPDKRVVELRAATAALLKLLEKPKVASYSWHDQVREKVQRINALYPTEVPR